MFGIKRLCAIVLINATLGVQLPLLLKQQGRSVYSPHGHAPLNSLFRPCADFYAYSCNAWLRHAHKPAYEPVWNPWIAAAHRIKLRLSRILARHDPTLTKPQTFYRSCLRIVDHENQYLKELISLVEKLGGWPLVDKKWEKSGYDWLSQVGEVTGRFGLHPLLKIHADLDYQDPKRAVIYVEAGNLIFPQFILTGSGYDTEIDAYERWILDTAGHMYNVSEVSHEVREIIRFEMNLAKIMGAKGGNERLNVQSLTKKFSKNWAKILKGIFGGFIEITPNTTLAVKNYPYLKNLFLLIDRTSPETVANYLIWSVIRDFSRDTTTHMRDLNFLIDQAILGVKDDLSPEYECLDKNIKYFSPLLVPPYLKAHISPRTFPKITSMFEVIKDEFIEVIKGNKWLSEGAKILSAGKIKKIQIFLGYPSKIFDGNLHLQYRNLLMTGNHFTNMIRLRYFKRKQHLSNLFRKKGETWPSTPFDVNAYYSVLQNAIFVPLGLFELPFFHLARDEILNYGALGFLIGHEISHSLDPEGILADSNGRIGKWWPQHDVTLYKNRTTCYGGGNEIGEKIADSTGLRISLGASKSRGRGQKEKFFVSFAQMWCEMSEETDIFAGDEHSPNLNRVRGLLNSTDFAATFSCQAPKGCDLW